MTLLTDLHALGGWAHRDTLLAAGWHSRSLREAMRAAGIPLVRRQWLVLPSASPALHEAARLGGRRTCVSEAESLGLWIRERDARPHVALPRNAKRSGEIVAHWSTGPAPAARLLVDPIENVLHHCASCLPEADALTIWESTVRKTLISLDELRRVRWTTTAARRLVELASASSDSGTETVFVRSCRAAGIPCRQQVHLYGEDVDTLIGDHLVVQIDGFTHHSDARRREQDLAHDRLLRLRGYTVFRFSYHDVMTRWPQIESQLRRAMAQGLHL